MDLSFYSLLNLFIVIIVSTIPLYLSVLILGGKTCFIKALYVMIVSAIITTLISYFLPFGALITFFILIWVYHEFFFIGWIRSVVLWLFQIVFIILISIILSLFGFESFMDYFLFNDSFLI